MKHTYCILNLFNATILSCSLLCGLTTSCGSTKAKEPVIKGPVHFAQPSMPLQSIMLYDRNGHHETLSTKERVEPFAAIDFLSPQPYVKVLRTFEKNKKGIQKSYITSYHENGLLHKYLEVENSRAHGLYVEWYDNGKIKLAANVMEGMADVEEKAAMTWIFDGLSKAWDEQGHLLTEIPYEKGCLQGEAKYYYPEGQLSRRVPYKQHSVEGVVQGFSPKGKLIESTSFVQNLTHGISEGLWETGEPKWHEEYIEGVLDNGLYTMPSGTIVSQVAQGNGIQCLFTETGPCELHQIINGVREGEVQVLKNQQVECRYFIKNEQKQGTETHYIVTNTKEAPTKPQVLYTIDWHEGVICGYVKTWYETGEPESQREMANNQKHGLYTAWYKDGSVMMIEEYARDKLLRGEYLAKNDKRPVSKIEKGTGVATLFDGSGNFQKRVHYKNSIPELEGA